MRLLRTIFLAVAALMIAVTPVALAGSPSPAELKALEIRGQALNQACLDPAQPGGAFRALCSYPGAQARPTLAESRALELRGHALTQACLDPAHSGAAYASLCTTAMPTPPTRVEASASGFDWGDFGIGAGVMFGVALLVAGSAAAVSYGRRSGVQPRTAS